jgi:hypothetical protein
MQAVELYSIISAPDKSDQLSSGTCRLDRNGIKLARLNYISLLPANVPAYQVSTKFLLEI